MASLTLSKKPRSGPREIETLCLQNFCTHMNAPDRTKEHKIAREKEAKRLMAKIEAKLDHLDTGFEPIHNIPLKDLVFVPENRVIEMERRLVVLMQNIVVTGDGTKKRCWVARLFDSCPPKKSRDTSQGAKLAHLKRRLTRLEGVYDELRREKWSGIKIDPTTYKELPLLDYASAQRPRTQEKHRSCKINSMLSSPD